MIDDIGYLYKVKESEVFVSSRPKKLSPDKEDETGYNPDAYLSVTDTYCSPIEGKILMWFPWNEARKPIPECYYATIKALIWWVEYLKLPKIQVFCDGGTHRSVTVFGAYLLATYSYKEALEIVAARKEYKGEGEDNLERCNPLHYVQGYLQEFPADWLLLKSMKEDRLGRLDAHTTKISKIVQARYGTEIP